MYLQRNMVRRRLGETTHDKVGGLCDANVHIY